ncbi:dTDP-4-dehydrorhamnose reductase [Klebsiella sp. WOUb02]|uniref:dTDP-4-dehydrorhamnose reductase n=1 Tax=Klebsiella sp. WOUb02 TaxID=3161071 RepID=UPI003CEB694A
MKVLLTGANGQLGRCFQDRVPAGWKVWATDTSVLDITNRDNVLAAVDKYQPNVIINAAAYTAVDKAESSLQDANLVNNVGPENLAIAAKKCSAIFIHVSTDYVFDGFSATPYVETDKTNPLSVYGKTKLDGETTVANVYPDTIIIRTAWVFSEYGNNFVKTMLRLGKERTSLGVVADQRGCPTYAGDIAHAIIKLIENNTGGGIYHFCGDKEVSWYEFAETIFEVANISGTINSRPLVKPIKTEEYPTPAPRPSYSTLNCTKIKHAGVTPSPWEQALIDIIHKL